MAVKPLLYLGAVQCLFTLPLCAQTTSAVSAEKVDTKKPPLQVRDFSIPVTAWPKTLNWQKAPDGIGEILAYPNPPGGEEFVWGKYRLNGTAQGLLFAKTTKAKQWHIVPALYQKSVRVAGEGQGRLWVEIANGGLVALDQHLKVVRRLPGISGHCIAIEPQGFWCLDDFRDNGYQAVVEYQSDGKEKRRFEVEGLALTPSSPPRVDKKQQGFTWNESGITWAAVDHESIWVSINNYRRGSIGQNDLFTRIGEQKYGRLDRGTGKFTTVESLPARLYPEHGEPTFDKPLSPHSAFHIEVLAVDENGIWLNVPPKTFLHARDDGKAMSYDVSSIPQSPSYIGRFAPHTPTGTLLWFTNDHLLQIQSDGRVRQLDLGAQMNEGKRKTQTSLDLLLATNHRIWYHTFRGQLVALAPDLSQDREIVSPLFGPNASLGAFDSLAINRADLAVENELYAWTNAGYLLNIDGETGSARAVESWVPPVLESDAHTSARQDFLYRRKDAFKLPEGRIAFTFSDLRRMEMISPAMGRYAEQLDKAHFFIFDPITDIRRESEASTEVKPLSSGERLYGYDATQLYQWDRNNWTVISKRSLPLPVAIADVWSDAKVVGTKKYFYQESTLGLYRVPWSQMGAQ